MSFIIYMKFIQNTVFRMLNARQNKQLQLLVNLGMKIF